MEEGERIPVVKLTPQEKLLSKNPALLRLKKRLGKLFSHLFLPCKILHGGISLMKIEFLLKFDEKNMLRRGRICENF